MLFELEESKKNLKDISISKVTVEFVQICKEVLEVVILPLDISHVTRIGKKEEGKRRPWRIKLSPEEKRKEIFMNLHKLKGKKSENSRIKTHSRV